MQTDTETTPAGRGWATSSFIAGLLWMVLALVPVPFTTPLGLPFAGYAICVGWLSRRNQLKAGDSLGARRAGWAMGLGCFGFVWLAVVYVILGGVLIAAFAALFGSGMQGTPTP